MPNRPRTDSERIYEALRVSERNEKQIEKHELNAERRAEAYREDLHSLRDLLFELVSLEKAKKKLVERAVPEAAENTRKRFAPRDLAEGGLYLVIGGLLSRIFPEIFNDIVKGLFQ